MGAYVEHLAFAHTLADAAGEVQRRYFRRPVAVDVKADASPVTVADREAEAAMRDLVGRRFPGHGLFGEEFGAEAADAEFVWVLDPIDGTKSFITGRPLFATLVGLAHGGRPVLGVIDQSVIGDRWAGAAGEGTSLNGAPARTRACATLRDAVLSTTSPLLFPSPAERAAYGRVEAEVRLAMFGGDGYAYGLVASGWVDLVVEAGLKAYDFTALAAVVEGAGGRLTDWRGDALTLASSGQVVAAGDPRAHGAALAHLREAAAAPPV